MADEAGSVASAARAPKRSEGNVSPFGLLAGSHLLPDKWAYPGRAFPGTSDQVRAVRQFVQGRLAGHRALDEAVLVASELAANAVVHSASGEPGGTFWVHLTTVPDEYVRVEVCDQGGSWVRRDQDGERPHGLDIVRQLAACFGVDGDARSGRIVWARLDVPRPCAPSAAGSPPHASRENVCDPAANGRAVQPGSADALVCSPDGERSWLG